MTSSEKVDPDVQHARDHLAAAEAEAAAREQQRSAEELRKTADKSAKSAGKASNPAASKAGPAAIGSLGGVTGLALSQGKAGMSLIDKASGCLTRNAGDSAKTAGKWAGRAIPFAGAAFSAYAAYDNFKSGDIVGGVLSTLGALPVVGLPAIGASLIWEGFFDGTGEVGLWDAPNGSSTWILPGTAAEVDGVTDADAQLRKAQQLIFAFKDGSAPATVWDEGHPAALRLDTDGVSKAAKDWLGGVSVAFADIESTMQSSGEPYMAEYAARLQPHLAAMAELPATVTALTSQLTTASDAAAGAYDFWLAANRDLRVQLSESGSLSDQGSLTAAQSSLAAADSGVDRADSSIASLLSEPAPALTSAAGTVAPAAPAPAPLAPTAPSPMPGVTAPGAGAGSKPETDSSKSDLAKLLENVGKSGGMPQMPAVPQMGNPLGGMGGGAPLGGGNPMGGNQGRKMDSGEGRKLDEKSDRKLDDRERKPLEEKADRKLSTAGGPANSTAAAPAPAVAPAGQPTAKPEGAVTKPGEPTAPKGPTTVDVKGEKVSFPPGSEKLAKMAQLLAAASPQQPMSLSDAAAASGLTPPVPGQDPGRQVQPVDAKPGDILVTDGRQYMLLGEGRFYDLQDFKTVGASELPADAGSRGGYFSLNDPSGPGGGAPVSPPAGGVAHDVPGGQPPAGTVDASPAGAGSGAVPSAGAPGVPAAGTGGGPANADATATGTGRPGPSTQSAPLDPAAVR